MPSPLLPPPPLLSQQLSSSHNSSISSHGHSQHRKSSADKPGLVKRNNSTSSLHRSASTKSTVSKNPKHPHHHHVAHTSASKHHRATSFGHRVPSYGKGLNKLTALTSVTTTDEPHKDHLTVEDLVARAGGMSMQRSLSEGSGTFLVKVCHLIG